MQARARGFTLVEVLVALVLLAVMSTFAWQGLDGVLRAREFGRESIEATTRLSTVLAQWEQDLQAVHDTGMVPPLEFDGQTLRLTRRQDEGVVLVAWALRSGTWQRWVSAPQVRVAGLQQVWLASQQLQGNEPAQLTLAEGVSDWQLYFYRGNAWSNAQSSGNLVAAPQASPAPTPPATGAGTGTGTGAAPPPTAAPAPQLRVQLPQAVRLAITLKPGKLTRDIALAPGAP